MPCYDSRDDSDELHARNDELARYLCEACSMLEGGALLVHCSPELRRWWAEHQAADKRRLEREMALQKDAEARKAAAAKLTPYERKLLGIK